MAKLEAGDYVYFIERRKLALCQIVKIKKFDARPDYTEYVLNIVEQWYNHEYFRPLPIFIIGGQLMVSRTEGVAYNAMWQFFSHESFEKHYGHLQSDPKNRRRVMVEIACRKICIVMAVAIAALIPRILNSL
jgi:hypothetical protein